MKTCCYPTYTLLLVCCMFEIVTPTSEAKVCNPPKRVYNLSGDVVIAGLIPVHAGSPLSLNEPGIIWAEAMMYAIREINNDARLLPNLKLGFDIRDSCNQVDLAVSATLDFILSPNVKQNSSFAVRKDNSSGSSCLCNTNNSSYPPVIAVVGGASSQISTSVSPLFSTDNIPQISYSSTSPSLSNKGIYGSFLRTIPSDVYQAEAIADMLSNFSWTYVSVVVSDDEYGRNGLVALRARLKQRGICIAVEDAFATEPEQERQRDCDRIVRDLQRHPRATVVVLWCERPKAISFLRSASGKLNVTWIGTESWGDNRKVVKEIGFDVIGGMLGVLPFLGTNKEFEKHLETLTPRTKDSDLNPWLEEYWAQEKFNNNQCVRSPSNCSSQELPTALSLPPNKYANVMDAVYAIAHGFDSLIKSKGNNLVMDKKVLQELLNHVKKANFKGQSAKGAFTFTDKGDPAFGAYLIKNLQGNSTSNNFVTVAQWSGETSNLEFREGAEIHWHSGTSTPLSRCSETCQPGFYAVFSDKTCCWSCQKCRDGFFKDLVGNDECTECADGYFSDDNRTRCVKLEEDFLKWGSIMSIVLSVFSFLGLVLIVFVIAVFRKYSRTAVVKASNRELTLVHLFCHGLIFLLPFLYMGRPKRVICIARSYLFSILFTVITSIMFLKTDRIVRIFNSKSRLTKRSRLLSNKVQFILTSVMATIPTAGTTVWLVLKPLTVECERTDSAAHTAIVFCAHASTLHIIHLSYILLMALLCTYEAYNARRLPESFNEAKYICFSMFGFVLMWVGYIPGYLGIAGANRQLMTSLFVLLSNFMTLLLIYTPKLNIILFQPQRNRHENFRQATLNACIQQVKRLSPTATPDTQRARSVTCLASATPPTPINFYGKIRSVSDLTDSSIGSRDQLFAGMKPARSLDTGTVGLSPLAFNGLTVPPSSRSGDTVKGTQQTQITHLTAL